MREGCLIGCLGLIAVTMILAIVAVVALDSFFGLFREADRISLAEFYGRDHDLMAIVEPEFDLVGSSVAESTQDAPFLVDWVLPYEVTLFADVDRETKTSTVTAAASMRRMAGFLSYYLPRGEGMEIFNGAKVTDLGVTSAGVAYVKATAPLSDEAVERAQPMAELTAGELYAIEGGHLGEITLDNTGGNAFIALEYFFDNGTEAEGAGLTDEEEVALGSAVTAAKLTFDTIDHDSVSLVVRARPVSPELAPEATRLFDQALRQIGSGGDESSVEIEGTFHEEDGELVGNYTLNNVRHKIGDEWKDAFEDFEARMDEHFERTSH